MKRAILLALLLSSLLPARALDCSQARTTVERRICATPSLVRLDRELNERYAAVQKRSDAALLRLDQLQWLRNRRQPCGDSSACLETAYRERVAQLLSWNQTQALPAELAGVYVTPRSIPVYDPERDRWVPEAAEDCLRIEAALPSGEHLLRLFSMQTNAHSCSVEGLARREGDALVLVQEGESGESCRLSVHFAERRLLIRAEGQACREHCGARASLDGVEYLRLRRDLTDAACRRR